MFHYGSIIVLAALSLLNWVAAAAPSGDSPFIVEDWGTKNKQLQKRLPQSSVITVLQTRDGYLWLGTLNGLVRFDGDRFTVFNESNTPGLPNNRIVYLFEDSRGWLWVGTDGGGVALIRNGLVAGLGVGAGSSQSKLISACESADGAVWLYTADGQLWRYFEGQLIPNVINEGRPSASRSMIAEPGGMVWVGSDTNQIAFGEVTSTHLAPFPVVTNLLAVKLDFLLASRKGGYWRLADRSIEKWRGSQKERKLAHYPWPDTPGAQITSACEDLDGNLVVGILGGGVYWFNATGQATHIGPAQSDDPSGGLSRSGVLSVCVDREGNLWVGTDGGGLNRVRRRVGQVGPHPGWVVQSACDDAEGGLWIGFGSGGLTHWAGETVQDFGFKDGRFVPEDGLISPNVWSVLRDPRGQVWAGTRAPGGLHQFRNGRFQPLAVAGTFFQDINALHQDRSSRLWVGTPSGLACWDGQGWQVFTTRNGLSADAVRAVADDAAGNLWIGTAGGGLNRLRDGKFTVYRKSEEGLPGDNISSLLADEDGALWIGTGSGLARFKNGHWTRYTTRDGLVSDSIAYLIEDGEGFLWAGSNYGLMRIAKQSLNDFAAGKSTTVSCRAYDEADGLPTSECTSGSQPAAVRTQSGKLWFPTISGLVGIDPGQLHPNTNPPPVMIESVLVGGHEQLTSGLRSPLPAEIQVPPTAERLEIRFTSLNLAAPERALFSHRLEGHESTWTEPRSSRQVSFTKLPPGHYQFHVRAGNEDGVWNEAGSTLAITVLPPFWRTWWFLTGSALALLGSIIATVHYVSTQKLHRELVRLHQKEALERERSRIARDLHDQLGANLTRVSLLGELVEGDKNQPDEVEAHARQISKTANETAHALDEIVWAANPANDTLEGLVNYICKYAQEFLATGGLRCRLDVPTELPATAVAPDFRHNLFLVAKEAVNNVVKHAQARSVRLLIKIESGQIAIEIEDDGRGPDGAATATGRGRNGLRNMSRRMEDVGGRFSITPAPERGTLVRLTAPLNRS